MGRDTRDNLGRSLRRGLAGSLAGLALLAGNVRAQDDGARIVTHGAQGYSVDVAGTNLVQVLTEVGQVAGFTVEAPDHFNSPLTLTLQDVPLDQLLRRVLRNENYIIVYRGGVQKTAISGEKIDKIFLLSQAVNSGPAVKGPAAGSPLAGPAAQNAPGPLGRGGPPPAPPPPPDAEEGGDAATRSARARARAEARRAALGEGQPAQPGAPGAPGGMPEAARMVQNPEDFTPPDGSQPPHGDVPAVDVPPPDFDGGDDGSIPEDY
jgi:hypothetical protein